MKKMLMLPLILLAAGCESLSMPPVDLDLEFSALGGLVQVRPQITIGDGEVGPTAIEVDIDTGEEAVTDENP